jgi:ABC-type nitrate/sulfonate/bicarbonate transport system ATPase subunit
MGTPAFRIENLSVSLGEPAVEILRAVSIDILQGETLAVVGKSGSGKSTLVNVLSGLVSSSGGVVHKAEGRFGALRTSTVFQDAHLFPWLTVEDNVALSLRLKNHPRNERSQSKRRKRALEVLSVLGIAEFAHRRPSELSGGQQQRVSIARAVTAEPDVLLLDEPFSALDVATRSSLQEWLVDHRHDLAPTVVLVTHDLSEAMYVADRIALMSDVPGALRVWSSDVSDRDQMVNSTVRAEIEQRFFAAPSLS